MDFNTEAIRTAFRTFWQTNKDNIRFRLGGKDVTLAKVPSFSIQQSTEGDYGSGYNFQCQALAIPIQIGCLEQPLNLTFVIKVSAKIQRKGEKPTEIVESIKDDTIYLSKNH